MVQGRKQILQEKKLESRSSSLETDDSGLREDGGVSDGIEAKVKVKTRGHNSNRPKVDSTRTKTTHTQRYGSQKINQTRE